MRGSGAAEQYVQRPDGGHQRAGGAGEEGHHGHQHAAGQPAGVHQQQAAVGAVAAGGQALGRHRVAHEVQPHGHDPRLQGHPGGAAGEHEAAAEQACQSAGGEPVQHAAAARSWRRQRLAQRGDPAPDHHHDAGANRGGAAELHRVEGRGRVPDREPHRGHRPALRATVHAHPRAGRPRAKTAGAQGVRYLIGLPHLLHVLLSLTSNKPPVTA
ncbi:hypothetical protein ON010_g15085 [Phytophthora cinnamomi]|nr:hypothetical protein ON010_g15085 [Phytophthora cinnamomi]